MKRRVPAAAVVLFLAGAWVWPARADQGGAQTQPAAARNVIMLEHVPQDRTQRRDMASLLERELVRQAVLIAARDELGLYTRDEALREPAPAGRENDPAIRLGVWVQKRGGKKIVVRLESANPEAKAVEPVEIPVATLKMDAREMELLKMDVRDMDDLAGKCEVLSRSTFRDDLRACGFDGKPEGAASDLALPEGIEVRLRAMTICDQFAAVRLAHMAMRNDGVSPALLGALVRGYANLGQLTRFEWSAAADVFTARSLLYARRLMQASPGTAMAHWHHIYALVMAGLHNTALAELKLDDRTDEQPTWTQFLEPACRYDTDKLTALAQNNPQDAGLGNYLAFLTRVNCGCTEAAMTVIRPWISTQTPTCDSVVDAACDICGVIYDNHLTQDGLTMSVAATHEALTKLGDLPANVAHAREMARENRDVMTDLADLCQAFVDAPDAAEPSWSALGRLLQDNNFVHAYRRVYFEARYWGIDPSKAADRFRPLVKGHPYEPVFDLIRLNFLHQSPAKPLEPLNLADASFRMPLAMAPAVLDGFPDFSTWWRISAAHMDPTAWDMERGLLSGSNYYTNLEAPLVRIRELRAISPWSPQGPAALARYGRDGEDYKTLEATFAGQPAFEMEFGWRLLRKGDQAAAMPHLQAYAKASPDVNSAMMLAKAYLKENDREHWLATMEGALDYEDYGLDHAQIDSAIAEKLIDWGRYHEALTYADAAADSWSEWALFCQAKANTALKNYGIADQIYRRACERYGGSTEWYLFCRGCGQGSLDDARAQAEKYFANFPRDWYSKAIIFQCEGHPALAIDRLKQDWSAEAAPYTGVWLALLYDMSNEPEKRDAMLAEVLEKSPAYLKKYPDEYPELLELAKTLAPWIKAPQAPLDVQAIAGKYPAMSDNQRDALDYFAGEFMIRHGWQDQGRRLLVGVAVRAVSLYPVGGLARAELHDAGVDYFDANVQLAKEGANAAAGTQPATEQSEELHPVGRLRSNKAAPE